MCGTCGCGEDSHIIYRKPGAPEKGHLHYHVHPHEHDGSEHEHGHHHHHDHDHVHSHEDDHVHSEHAHSHHPAHHDHSHETSTIRLERNIMAKNDMMAERNRGYFEALNITVLNLVSSPGSGKTSVLERTLKELAGSLDAFVIEGDQQTMLDAERIKAAGAPVIQINTGSGCHLDALMVNKAVKQLEPKKGSYLFIENVGNLVCPSLFDLGESKRVVIISVTEGADKPSKYPTMFETAQLCLINKSDLLPYVDFSIEEVKEHALRINPKLSFIVVSARSGEGFELWYDWLKGLRNA